MATPKQRKRLESLSGKLQAAKIALAEAMNEAWDEGKQVSVKTRENQTKLTRATVVGIDNDDPNLNIVRLHTTKNSNARVHFSNVHRE